MPTYTVRLARGAIEYTDVEVEASDEREAEELACERAAEEDLAWALGDDRDHPYAVDSWETKGDE